MESGLPAGDFLMKCRSVQISMRFFLGLSDVLLKRMSCCGLVGEGQWHPGCVDSPSIAQIWGSPVDFGDVEQCGLMGELEWSTGGEWQIQWVVSSSGRTLMQG